MWTYESTTSTSGLCSHIKKYHLELYTQLCKANQIDPHESIVGKSVPVSVPASTTSAPEAFSSGALLRHIRNFVVSDDQVRISYYFFLHHKLTVMFQSLNVIECPEFLQLLLFLREDLHEEDLPHHDKLRRSIMEAWHTYYQSLREELAVM